VTTKDTNNLGYFLWAMLLFVSFLILIVIIAAIAIIYFCCYKSTKKGSLHGSVLPQYQSMPMQN
jgi:hypothetical protein